MTDGVSKSATNKRVLPADDLRFCTSGFTTLCTTGSTTPKALG